MSARDARPAFRGTRAGIETLPGRFDLPRHRHLRAYATVVLAGQFEESGYVGRIRASAGDVLIHPALDCHANQMVTSGVTLIRLDWPDLSNPDLSNPDLSNTGGLYRVDQVDALARLAEKDVVEATQCLDGLLRAGQPPTPGQRRDWPDLLAADLARDATIEVGAWADAQGLARETVSRGFAAAYGTVPIVFRAELRARAAWLRITRGTDRLSTIAADTGFADQAHMTRWIQRLTGATPTAWRVHTENRGWPSTIVPVSAGFSPLPHNFAR